MHFKVTYCLLTLTVLAYCVLASNIQDASMSRNISQRNNQASSSSSRSRVRGYRPLPPYESHYPDHFNALSIRPTWQPNNYHFYYPETGEHHPAEDVMYGYEHYFDPSILEPNEFKSYLQRCDILTRQCGYPPEGNYEQERSDTVMKYHALEHVSHLDDYRGAVYLPADGCVIYHSDMPIKEVEKRFNEVPKRMPTLDDDEHTGYYMLMHTYEPLPK